MCAAPINDALIKPEGRVLSTLEVDGSRRWMYPKLSKGLFWQARRVVGYVLIAIFVAIPYLKIGAKPLLLLDVAHRRFTLFGKTFLPTDTILLALFGVSTLLFIFFITALLGRVWCGWACPQTVYMEFLFRPLERLFSGRTGVGGKGVKLAGGRRFGLYAVYFIASFFLAHTFLSYFVGVDQLRQWVLQPPSVHPAGFAIVVVVTAMMMFNFAFFREQTCIIACPYGRFQSALLDRQSLVISYDRKRGEPRGAARKTVSLPVAEAKGDCVDCDLCVQVCPTGIDIREGLQIECVGCAQCIDVCNTVMRKIKRPTGLIRYSSQAAMAGEKLGLFRPRMVVYPGIILVLLGLMTYLLLTHAATDVTLLRGLGQPWVLTDKGDVENVIRVKLQNRTDVAQVLKVGVADRSDIQAIATHDAVTVPPWEAVVEPVRVVASPREFVSGILNIKLRVTGKGVSVDRPFKMLGPFANQTQPASQTGETHAQH